MSRLDITGGVSFVDHYMDNSQKPNRKMMEAGTNACTRSWAAHAHLDLDPGLLGDPENRPGRDQPDPRRHPHAHYPRQRRHLLRQTLAQRGPNHRGRFRDRGNPPVAIYRPIPCKVAWTPWTARPARPMQPSLGGKTVREQYVRFYGPGAAETDRTETLGLAGLTTGRPVRPPPPVVLARRPEFPGSRRDGALLRLRPGPGRFPDRQSHPGRREEMGRRSRHHPDRRQAGRGPERFLRPGRRLHPADRRRGHGRQRRRHRRHGQGFRKHRRHPGRRRTGPGIPAGRTRCSCR